MMKKRWIALYVENYSGVLAKISSLFSAKLYNLDTLTVGKNRRSKYIKNDYWCLL